MIQDNRASMCRAYSEPVDLSLVGFPAMPIGAMQHHESQRVVVHVGELHLRVLEYLLGGRGRWLYQSSVSMCALTEL